MYNKIFQIDNSKIGFSADGIHLFAPKKEKGFVVCDLKNGAFQEYTTDFDVFEILPVSTSKFIVTENRARLGTMFCIDNQKIELIQEFPFYSVNSVKGNLFEIQVTKEIEGFNARWYPATALYDWQKDEILWEAPYDLFFLDDYIIGRRFNAPSRLSPNTGEVLWEYSFADYPQTKDSFGYEEAVSLHNSVGAFTGVISNKLWVSLNTLQHLVLDINTGRQLALLGQPYNYKKDYYTQKVMSGGKIDVKQNILISLGNCLYREINPDTYEATFYDLREEFDKYGVSSMGDIHFDDNYIYFYDKIFFGEQPRNKVAVLDRKTLKVVWVHDFAQYGTFPMQLEKNDTHLFVLDSGGTLHIFEKETAKHT